MVLRGFALSLLVPEKYYRKVSQHIDQTRLTVGNRGQRLVYLKVASMQNALDSGDQLHPTSLCHKLRYRSGHPLTPWVTAHIENRFDYRCCDSVEQFREAPRLAMTRNRHTKVGNFRHEKDDRNKTVDPSQFVLGWDNREKKRRLEERIARLDLQISEILQTISHAEKQASILNVEAAAIVRCLEVETYDAINCRVHELAIKTLQDEEEELKSNNDKVRVLEERLAEKLSQAKLLDGERSELERQIGELGGEMKKVKHFLDTAINKLAGMKADGRLERAEPLFESLDQTVVDLAKDPESQADFSTSIHYNHRTQYHRIA